jgi:hypothetical protein
MSSPLRILRDRLVPAVLTAAGVTALAAGLLNYASPAQAGRAGASPSTGGLGPGSSLILPSLPPIDSSAVPSAGPSAAANRVATRVVIQSLGIDLPVIAQPNDNYPACNVAMHFEHPGLGQPGSGRSVYLYAHARPGMFLPLLTASQRNNGRSLLASLVEVYTNDDQHFYYSISRVIRHVPADEHFLDAPLAVKQETLWLQTSEGPGASFPKLQVKAEPLGVVPADHEAAHPKARPVACG